MTIHVALILVNAWLPRDTLSNLQAYHPRFRVRDARLWLPSNVAMRRWPRAVPLSASPIPDVHHSVMLVHGTKARAFAIVAKEGVSSTFVPLAPSILYVLHVWEVVIGAELCPFALVPVARSLRATSELAMAIHHVHHCLEAMLRAEGGLLPLEAIDGLTNAARRERGKQRSCTRSQTSRPDEVRSVTLRPRRLTTQSHGLRLPRYSRRGVPCSIELRSEQRDDR